LDRQHQERNRKNLLCLSGIIFSSFLHFFVILIFLRQQQNVAVVADFSADFWYLFNHNFNQYANIYLCMAGKTESFSRMVN